MAPRPGAPLPCDRPTRGAAAHAEAWEAVYARIGEAVELVAPDGPVAEFLLHIEDDRAWFRWNDEPFDED
ncbi:MULTISPECIES: hypothetical protein [unclassified Streptomyces]|uniref:hypothetical protein n=1 Tax=unclassified Streptomyces TaxID=2593676 RepID=UPI00381301F1